MTESRIHCCRLSRGVLILGNRGLCPCLPPPDGYSLPAPWRPPHDRPVISPKHPGFFPGRSFPSSGVPEPIEQKNTIQTSYLIEIPRGGGGSRAATPCPHPETRKPEIFPFSFRFFPHGILNRSNNYLTPSASSAKPPGNNHRTDG